MVYGNHRSTVKYRRKVLTETAAGVALGKATMIPVTLAKDIVGLRRSPVSVVEEEKL